jgi:hypothetical protein
VHHGERQAGVDPSPVHQHGAGAALAAIAPLLGPEQAEVLAQGVQQGHARLDGYLIVGAVDPQRDVDGREAGRQRCHTAHGV